MVGRLGVGVGRLDLSNIRQMQPTMLIGAVDRNLK